MAQIDLTPATNPVALGGPGIHFHSPAGNTAGAYNCSSDFPSTTPKGATASTVSAKITGTLGVVVRLSSPA